MKKFNWEEFKDTDNKIAVHCKTKEQAIDFCKQMYEHGMKWCDGSSYLETTRWGIYRAEIMYFNNGTFGNENYYKNEGYTILEWSDYMKKDFTKDDLKTGMVVTLRSGNEYQVMLSTTDGDILIKENGSYLYLSDDYEDNLIFNNFHEFDIMVVKEPSFIHQLASKYWDKMEVIWERYEAETTWSNGLTLEENHKKMWTALSDNPLLTKREYLKQNNIDEPYDECFACEYNVYRKGEGDCSSCPICGIDSSKSCLNGLYCKYLSATGFEKAKIANEIANLKWENK